VPSPFVFLLALLGVYRLSHMIAMEDGPFDAFAELRDRVGQGNWIGRGLHCPLCLSFWLSLCMVGWLGFVGLLLPPYNLISWLGLAGGCLVLHKLLYGAD
jgi:hypothetical protein